MTASIPGSTVERLLANGQVLLARCVDSKVELAAWVRENRSIVDSLLRRNGGILFRGFSLRDEQRFFELVSAVCEPMEYVYRSTPRTDLGRRIYTATEYPAHQVIPVHCENAYQADWPMQLFFMCMLPARTGGETPLADVAAATAAIDPEVRETFLRKKIMYVRNYRTGLDLPWQSVFRTNSKSEVESYCAAHGMHCQWLGDDHLRTQQVGQALVRHPDTQQLLWFNQAHLFHASSLSERVRAALGALYNDSELPRNALHGDGSPIDEAQLTHVRDAFARHTYTFTWELGDVLLVDNMSIAHGRNTFEGDRRILVAMGDPYSVRLLRAGQAPAGRRTVRQL